MTKKRQEKQKQESKEADITTETRFIFAEQPNEMRNKIQLGNVN